VSVPQQPTPALSVFCGCYKAAENDQDRFHLLLSFFIKYFLALGFFARKLVAATPTNSFAAASAPPPSAFGVSS
jgi:hypothetical protein